VALWKQNIAWYESRLSQLVAGLEKCECPVAEPAPRRAACALGNRLQRGRRAWPTILAR
jgi:hypothetical protein